MKGVSEEALLVLVGITLGVILFTGGLDLIMQMLFGNPQASLDFIEKPSVKYDSEVGYLVVDTRILNIGDRDAYIYKAGVEYYSDTPIPEYCRVERDYNVYVEAGTSKDVSYIVKIPDTCNPPDTIRIYVQYRYDGKTGTVESEAGEDARVIHL